ncbi:MAG: acyltransferase [Bacillota bacterium]
MRLLGRRLTRLPDFGPLNPLQYWYKHLNPLRVTWNFLCIYLAKYSPSLGLKLFFYRLTGARIGRNVSIGLAVVFDIFYPHLITIEENSVIGFNSVILCHDFRVKEALIGPVHIGKNVLVGANSTVLPGVTIGDGAQISAMSLINKDIPPGIFAGGVPVRVIRAASPDDL